MIGITVDTARDMLKRAGGIHKLAQTSEAGLAQLPGIGVKRAAKIKALTQWALLLNEVEVEQQIQIRSPADIANLLMLEMSLLEREELRVMVLDTKNQVRSVEIIYQGSVNTAVVRVAEIFRAAIVNYGKGLISQSRGCAHHGTDSSNRQKVGY
jgi:DNA repair protein RadC